MERFHLELSSMRASSRKRHDVGTVHGESTVCCNEAKSTVSSLLAHELCAQIVHVQMLVTSTFSLGTSECLRKTSDLSKASSDFAQPNAIDDGCMVQFI